MAFTRAERDKLLERLRELDSRLFPADEANTPSSRVAARLQDDYLLVLGEYSDRLPRVVMGISPFNGVQLKRAFDPYGLDGPWWWKDCPVRIEEPDAPPAFQVLLGALALGDRLPAEATDEVIPGPGVPFVVPRLLGAKGFAAVIARLELATGDIAYAISYWCEAQIPPANLHQPWLRQELWFKNSQGVEGWTIANDPWDFSLEPWIAAGKLFWVDPATGGLFDRNSAVRCPFLGLEGYRQPQLLSGGERTLLDLPDGAILNPFDDG
jgi:hypothetical protein